MYKYPSLCKIFKKYHIVKARIDHPICDCISIECKDNVKRHLTIEIYDDCLELWQTTVKIKFKDIV